MISIIVEKWLGDLSNLEFNNNDWWLWNIWKNSNDVNGNDFEGHKDNDIRRSDNVDKK